MIIMKMTMPTIVMMMKFINDDRDDDGDVDYVCCDDDCNKYKYIYKNIYTSEHYISPV